MSSKTIPEATPIILTAAERGELESLVRSTKTEQRTHFKARLVLLAADGASTRAIAREVGCTIGTASKWRVRYAKDRVAGFSETGNRGPQPKYGPEAGRRILALLDEKPPAGHGGVWAGASRCGRRRSSGPRERSRPPRSRYRPRL